VVILAATSLAAAPSRAETRANTADAAELVQIAEGPFVMGNDHAGKEEAPAHSVTLSGYWIYRHEVTVAQYLKFAQATGREVKTEPRYGFVDLYPITYVAWDDADAYCRFAGGALPTEAQWEKAARGSDGRLYPWGNQYDKARAHVGPGVKREPKPVGSYPQGASPYGVLDMTGNVDEWVNDHYASDYYRGSPAADPPGADRGQRGVRGGSFQIGNEKKLTTTTRSGKTASTRGDSTGFRCAQP
jgi:formylglycine-generating enzyme required for sulfatase activity